MHNEAWQNRLDRNSDDFDQRASAREDTIDKTLRRSDQLSRHLKAKQDEDWQSKFNVNDYRHDQELFNRENAIKAISDRGETHKAKLEISQAEMAAGRDPYATLGLSGEAEHVDEFKFNADQLAAAGTRKVIIEQVAQSDRAQAIKDKTLYIDGQLYQEYASGIRGEAGILAVEARAKEEVIDVLIKDTKLMNAAIDSVVAGSPEASYDKFFKATSIQERVSHMMSFVTQGTSGDEKLREASIHMEGLLNKGSITEEEFIDLKSLVKELIPSFKSRGEDLKRFYGTPKARFSEIVSNPTKSWFKGTAESFVASDPIAQLQTIKAYAYAGEEDFEKFVGSITPQLFAGLKDEVKSILGAGANGMDRKKGLTANQIVGLSESGDTSTPIAKNLNRYRHLYPTDHFKPENRKP